MSYGDSAYMNVETGMCMSAHVMGFYVSLDDCDLLNKNIGWTQPDKGVKGGAELGIRHIVSQSYLTCGCTGSYIFLQCFFQF